MRNRESALNTAEAMKFTSRSYLRWLQTSSSGIGNESSIFEIQSTAPLNDYTRCDYCDKKGKFLVHQKDHEHMHSIFITCEDDSPENCLKALAMKSA
ncbi:hypothetical protein KKH23_01025 [Patescibacteria group bacterium]|nr:hypothetical protein [Patescibacteria group bacterium]MBU0777075.1 hypothetical protein [Patescibacteria group bacterium]MBU0845769.1 hypothetical protein [Patescibacteria group bacterium]MBU0922795.1 hypothetical protein [Patescibacteria group bacterium]MBU1066471.1 hypothetical protein [Patescibacteria group bacterium]